MSLFNKFEMFDVCTYRFCFLMLDESIFKKYIQYCKARYIYNIPINYIYIIICSMFLMVQSPAALQSVPIGSRNDEC